MSGAFDQFHEGELRCAVDGDKQIELALGGTHLSQINMEVADRVAPGTSSCLVGCRLPLLVAG